MQFASPHICDAHVYAKQKGEIWKAAAENQPHERKLLLTKDGTEKQHETIYKYQRKKKFMHFWSYYIRT